MNELRSQIGDMSIASIEQAGSTGMMVAIGIALPDFAQALIFNIGRVTARGGSGRELG